MTELNEKAKAISPLMKISYFALMVALSLSTWVWVQEGRQPSITIWVIRILPLLIFVRGVLREDLRTLAWLCFVVLLYFVMAVTESMSPFALWINYVELALTVVIFCSATLFIRWRGRYLAAQRREGEVANGEN
ncbi:DUF2069 domain-containing protein [Spongiibacter taiwanensis]|uniref:DUF2069 domain-containing protein n=1 Tax=Spongiibacter taiwanensis TaxID=1748242 RepID=UPI002034F1C5|nr:DUF2069 domain-containing protein [Spongiibacter taiwanensis]USA44126.1 DUF2069 domain-containing protein [Spongiibacter taiwanensis]